MKRHLRQRFWAEDGDPGPLAWGLAIISLVLPIAGLGLCLAGGLVVLRGESAGWALLGIGAVCLGIDIVIDLVWAHPGVTHSDEPNLNRRGEELVGRRATVAEAIEGGRGKVRIGDTVWQAEGPDLALGALVRVCGTKGTALVVSPATD
ncbi:MAG: NfeD family protein [Hyphomicrobiaceae bacterium]